MENIKNTIQIKGDFNEHVTQIQIKTSLRVTNRCNHVRYGSKYYWYQKYNSIQTGELCKEAMIFSKDIISKNGFLYQKYSWESFNEIVALGKKFLEK